MGGASRVVKVKPLSFEATFKSMAEDSTSLVFFFDCLFVFVFTFVFVLVMTSVNAAGAGAGAGAGSTVEVDLDVVDEDNGLAITAIGTFVLA